jgi:hypothetical protein
MASSFIEQIPVVMGIIKQLRENKPNRHRMLDIGKGFGKYGFLTHEYFGLDFSDTPDPTKTLREQSRWTIDAVEIQPAYMWPHIDHIYETVYQGDILELYPNLPAYDIVLMTDVIEHLDKQPAIDLVKHLLGTGAVVVVSTPAKFFHQDVFKSEWEHHRSHWRVKDFEFAPFLVWETVREGRIYVLAAQPERFVIFGSGPYRRLRRVARGLIDAVS